MTRTQQKTFIRELCRAIEKTVTENVKRTPETENWDGHELRVLIYEHTRRSADMSCISREPHNTRSRNYRNVITTTNVL